MQRTVAIVVVIALVLGSVFGIVLLLESDGPNAVTIGDTTISQQYIDDELRALGENEQLKAAVEASQAPAISSAPGSVTTDIGAGWVGLIVSQHIAARAVEHRGLEETSDDRDRGRALAVESVGGNEIFESLPSWFRKRLVDRWTPVAVLERDVVENPSPALLEQVQQQCPSGRYVSHILVANEDEATAIKRALDRGGDFAEIARNQSLDQGSATQGGALGCIDGQQFVEPFASAAASQPVGVVSDPVTTEFGSHLILVSDETPTADLQRVAIAEVLSRARGADVHIEDERYGTWDRENGQVLPPIVPGAAAVPTA